MAITSPQGIDLQAPEALELKTTQATTTDRDNISLVTRYQGLKVYVEDTELNWQLKGGITNAHWIQIADELDVSLFYTKINMQTPGESIVHWDNIIGEPAPYWEASVGTYGDILNPISGVKSILLEENGLGLTSLVLKNTNDVESYAGAVLELKGSGADYTNNVYFGKYGDNYQTPSWAGNGVLATDSDLVISAIGSTSEILFQVGGGAYHTPNDVFNMLSSGLLTSLTTNYEILIISDNDIPNKKYVDDLTSSFIIDVDWGDIGGTLTNQTDLQNALNNKKDNFSENTAFNKYFGTGYSNIPRGDHGHTIISVPESSAEATSEGLILTNVLQSNYLKQSTALPHQEGLIFYNESSNSFRAYNDITDVALDVGQELWGRVTNTNVYTLGNGKVGYVRGSAGTNLDCDLADSSDMIHSERVVGVFTNDILPGEDGYITRFGIVRDIDTSSWAEGDLLYLDAHNPGEMTNIRPITPHYPVRIAVVMFVHATLGAIGVDTIAFTGSDTSVAVDGIIDGVVLFTPQIEVVVEGGIIYADVVRGDEPLHDLPFIIDGKRYILNTTTNTGPAGAARIAIPPGIDASTLQESRLYIKLNASIPELAITTSAIAEPYANLATFAVFNDVRTLADGQPFMYRRVNNAISSEDIGIDGSFGLVTVLANAIRFKLGSNWLLGQDATPEVNNTTIRTTLSAGLGAQVHVDSLPTFDGLSYTIYNDTANLATYADSTNLTDIISDAAGNTLLSNNTHYTIRLFYQLNSNGIGNNVIATRPLGFYTNSAEAIQDPLNYTVNINDTSIEETIYPIYDMVISRTGGSGGTIALTQLTDLRTKIAGGVGGGGASGGGGTDDKVRVSAADTVNDYLFPKLVAGDNISLDILNPGGVETLQISASGSEVTIGIGGDYATVSEALTATEYDLKLISNITEVSNIDLTTITNINTGIYSIDLDSNTFSISGDNISLNNIRISNGTITVSATADKTTIIGCRTSTSIVDSGTGTTLFANNIL